MPKSSTPSDIKAQNRQSIYHYIRNNEPVSKQDIVVGLGLSLPTVTQNLDYLKRHNLIETSKAKKTTGGRSATTYFYKKDGKTAIGIYITGNHLNVVCVDISGTVIYAKRERMKFNLDDEDYLKKIGDLVTETKHSTKFSEDNLLGVGIAVPSLVSDDGEQVIFGLTHNFTGKTRTEISKYISYETKMFHDSYVAGFAEVWISSIKNAVYISLNNSVGGSIIINNHIYTGDNNRSGEIGHMTIQPQNGKTCYCGKKGCFDTLCNAGLLDSYTDGNLAEFFQLLKNGDKKASDIWARYLDDLSLAVHSIRMLFDCTIILGGYVGAYMEDYMEDLWKRVDARSCFGDEAQTYVIPCKYKVESTAAGAAIQLIDDFIKNI